MNKTISITINGLVFNIEEDAYGQLYGYLDGLKRHYQSQDYGSEIYSDIESRIAEQFTEKIRNGKKEVITKGDVEEIVRVMGSLNDLADDDQPKKPASRPAKRLFRNPDDSIIGGVASGLASYFDIDPIIPRVLFVVAGLVWGYGILIYILLWIIVPEAKNNVDRLQMKGNPVTVATLQETAKDRGNRNFGLFRHFIGELFALFGRFLRWLGPVISILAGLFIILAAFCAAFALTFTTAVLLSNPQSPYIDPLVTEVLVRGQYFWLVTSGYLALAIPAIMAIVLGITFVRRRNSFNRLMSLGLVSLWLASAITFGALAFKVSPEIEAAVRNRREHYTTREFSETGFSRIRISGAYNYTLTQGPDYSIKATGDDFALQQLKIVNQDGELYVSDSNRPRLCLVCLSRDIEIAITAPQITGLRISGASTMAANGFTADDLQLAVSGASKLSMQATAQNLGLRVSGASNVSLSGQSERLVAETSGASSLNASGLRVKTAAAEASGASRQNLNVVERLQADASGSSRIFYLGDPLLDVEMSGAGRIMPDPER